MKSEKSKRNKSAAIAVLLHAGMLLLFFFMLAWTAPNPPIPEYGIDLNMALSDAQVLNDDKPVSAETPSEVTEVREPTEEVETLESQPTEPVEAPVEEIVEPVESPAEQVSTEDINSPDVVEKVAEKEQPKEVKESTEEVKKEKETEKEKVEKAPPAKPSVDQRAIYKKNEPGTGGGSQGSTLNLTGWMWDERPAPNDRSEESGKIIFKIVIDDEGFILDVRTQYSNVSPDVLKVYKNSVEDLTFTPTSENRSVAAQSSGTITFIIKSK